MHFGLLLPANFSLDGSGNGVRVQAAKQADALERAGHRVDRLSPWDPFPPDGYDVVQAYSGGFPHAGLAKRKGVAMLGWAPVIDTNEPNWRYRLAARAGHAVSKVYTIPGVFQDQARAADRVICRSAHEQRRVVGGLGVDPAKTRIVLNGIDPPAPMGRDEARRRLASLGLADEFVLHVSAYTQGRKHAVPLAEAVGRTGLPLVIAGTAEPGATLDRLRALEKQYPSVRLLGYVDRPTLEALFAACRVFTLPSYHEGTGLAALEAAAHGATVVITRHGGAPDYFGDRALYVGSADLDELERVHRAAWDAPPSDALQRHVLEHLTWDQSAAALAAAYA